MCLLAKPSLFRLLCYSIDLKKAISVFAMFLTCTFTSPLEVFVAVRVDYFLFILYLAQALIVVRDTPQQDSSTKRVAFGLAFGQGAKAGEFAERDGAPHQL